MNNRRISKRNITVYVVLFVAVAVVATMFDFRKLPLGCKVSWRTLSIVQNASKIETFRCGMEKEYYQRNRIPSKPLGKIGYNYIYERGPVEGNAFARKLHDILRDPKTYGHGVISCIETSPILLRASSDQGSVDIMFDYGCPYMNVTRYDTHGRILEEDDAEIAESRDVFWALTKEAFPNMAPGDYLPVQIQTSPKLHGS